MEYSYMKRKKKARNSSEQDEKVSKASRNRKQNIKIARASNENDENVPGSTRPAGVEGMMLQMSAR
jgi:hypothetical protein